MTLYTYHLTHAGSNPRGMCSLRVARGTGSDMILDDGLLAHAHVCVWCMRSSLVALVISSFCRALALGVHPYVLCTGRKVAVHPHATSANPPNACPMRAIESHRLQCWACCPPLRWRAGHCRWPRGLGTAYPKTALHHRALHAGDIARRRRCRPCAQSCSEVHKQLF